MRTTAAMFGRVGARESLRWSDLPVASIFLTPRKGGEGAGLVGFAAIKYTAIVVIVLAILAFLAWYVLPRFA